MERIRSITISFVCKNSGEEILRQESTIAGDYRVLVEETLAIQEAIRIAIRMKIDNIIIESDSQAAVGYINGRFIAPKPT